MPTVQPFEIRVPDAVLDDLRERLARTRWPDSVDGAGWDYGTSLAYLRELVDHWRGGFDWRAREAALNRMPQFRAEAGGVGLHFVHARGKGPNGGPPPLPLVLHHGWPGSFYQMAKLLPLLADPGAHGGDPADAFDVVVPSLPGYGFSDKPRERGMTVARMAAAVHALVTERLGYARYGVAGGDVGAGVSGALAAQFPDAVVGAHANGGNPYLPQVPNDLSPAEQEYVKKAQAWMQAEGAYASLQSTKPQTAAFALTDSPAGLAAWLVEKYRAWSDCALPDGTRDVERRFTKDELLTFVTLYWVTETIHPSMRVYYEGAHDSASWSQEGEGPPQATVPAGLAVWPADIAVPPREWAERTGKLARYTVMPRGGHFAEWEEPELVAEELRAFFRPLRAGLSAAA